MGSDALQRASAVATRSFIARGGGFDAALHGARVKVDAAGGLRLEAGERTLALQTTSIAATAATGRAAPVRGAVATPRGVATEELAVADGALEQSWRFAAPPAHGGDLVIRVRASGLPLRARTRTGLHFGAPARAGGFCYGPGTWVDADGRKTAVEPTLEGDTIVLTVPAEVVQRSRFPAVLDPVVYAEQDIDQPVVGDAYQGQVARAVWDGTNFFVVWRDTGTDLGSTIVAAHVTPAGQVVEPTPIVVYASSFSATTPDVAFDGTNYLVAFLDYPTSTSGNGQVEALRVSQAGAVLDAAPLVLSPAGVGAASPRVDADDKDFVVVWQDNRLGYEAIFGARVSPAGASLDGTGVRLSSSSNTTNTEALPLIAWDGAHHLVLWNISGYGLLATRYDDNLTAADATTLQVASSGQSVGQAAVAARPGEWLVVFYDLNSGTTLVNFVADDGSMLNGTGVPIPGVSLGSSGYGVAFDGTQFMISGVSGTTVLVTSMAEDGGALGAPVVISGSANYDSPGLAATDGGVGFAVWSQPSDSNSHQEIEGALIDDAASAPIGSVVHVAQQANAEQAPAVAFDGTNHLVVWLDHRSTSTVTGDVYAALFHDGDAPTSSPILVVSGASQPQVAFDGTDYVVAWVQGGLLYGQRYSTSGAAVDASPFQISPNPPSHSTTGFSCSFCCVGPTGPEFCCACPQTSSVTESYAFSSQAVSCAGATCAATWGSSYNFLSVGSTAPGGSLTYLRRFSGPNMIDASAVTLSGNSCTFGVPPSSNIVASPSQFDVEFQNSCTDTSLANSVIDADGGGTGPVVSLVGNAMNTVAGPATDGTDFLVGWRSAGALEVLHIGADGGQLDAAPTALSNDSAASADVLGYDGTNYAAFWRTSVLGQGFDIMGQFIGAAPGAGPVLADGGVSLVATATAEGAPAAAPTATAGTSFLAFTRYDPSAGEVAERVKIALVSELSAQGASCGADGECFTGHCVDGVCCDSACGGGLTTDCQACSVAAGGAVDGTCGPVGDGATCDDGRTCSTGDRCSGGACVPTDSSGCACSTDQDCALGACQASASCDFSSGTCSYTNLPDDAGCDDGDACTGGEHCTAGVCGNPSTVTSCVAQDDCHSAGLCDALTGACSNPALDNGTPCDGGFCNAGVCAPPDAGLPGTTGSSSSSGSAGSTTSSSGSASGSGSTGSASNGSSGASTASSSSSSSTAAGSSSASSSSGSASGSSGATSSSSTASSTGTTGAASTTSSTGSTTSSSTGSTTSTTSTSSTGATSGGGTSGKTGTPPKSASSGCGCNSAPSAIDAGWLALGLLMFVRRRRAA